MTKADFEGFWVDGEAGSARVREAAPAVNGTKTHDLEERTAWFGEAITEFAQRIPLGPVNNRLIDQLVGRPLWQEAKELHLVFCAILSPKRHPRR